MTDTTASKLHATTDAAEWAKEFMERFGPGRSVADEGDLIAWFSNAIETGRTAGQSRAHAVRDALLAAADGRDAYGSGGVMPGMGVEFIQGQAAGYRRAANVLAGEEVLNFLADEMPSWMWSDEITDHVFRTNRFPSPPTEPEPPMPAVDVQSFTFQPEHDGSLSLESAVFQALGAASTCWDPMDGTGVFQSERAKAIGEALLAVIAEQDLSAKLAIALEHTQEYLGSETLPPIEGWSWYDALTAYHGQPFVPADRRPPAVRPAGPDVTAEEPQP